MKQILVAGSTGYLGKYIVKELQRWDFSIVALARHPEKLRDLNSEKLTIHKAEVTDPDSLTGSCDGVDTVISTIGITRQQDGLTYMEVDFQANLNLLNEAKRAGVRKFIYVSVLNGKHAPTLKMVEAKERFVHVLEGSGLKYTIIRPNGFFSDMREVLDMAKKGRVYLFGDGENKLNPIHGADLAELCVQSIARPEPELEVGGPDILTHNEMAELALMAWKKPVKIIHVPDVLRVLTLRILPLLTSQRFYGPLEFFLTFMGRDNIATRHGTHRLHDFFKKEVHKQRSM